MALRKDFLWGGAIAANQCEGAWDVNGKGPSVPDMCTNGSHTSPKCVTSNIEEGTLYPSHEAIDFYHRYEEDIALMAEMADYFTGCCSELHGAKKEKSGCIRSHKGKNEARPAGFRLCRSYTGRIVAGRAG